ncbi:acyltransferase [Caulobacter sp. 17J65-9]|uniref:acyltransferase family protein n=1 Tax=Caulobacter sp. 17J65-9 TaxID=2709382 RepID=UPI0013C564DD|nr:acyltransferase [Caulobacter sp. 17J65-9]
MEGRGRNEVIDAFRGISVLLVLIYHYTVRWSSESARDILGYDYEYSALLSVGSHGVEIFFVISGLVIAMTVERSASAAEFAVRRIARIYPALLVAATFTFVICQFGPYEFRRDLADYGASLLFFPDEIGRRFVDGAYWSLAVEVKFYAVVAVSMMFLRDRFWIGVAAVAVLAAVSLCLGVGDRLLSAKYWPYFLIGMSGWYVLFKRSPWPAGLLGGIGLTSLFIFPPYVGSKIFVLGAVSLMFVLIQIRVVPPLGPLPKLGRISYSLYLIHQYVGVLLIGSLTGVGAPDWVAIGTGSAAAIGLAAMMYRWVEIPAQRWVSGRLLTRTETLDRVQSAA